MSRRLRGEGTIGFHEPSQRYMAQISAGKTVDGRRVRPTVYGATEAEVLDRLAELKGDLRAGRRTDARAEGERTTLASWLDQWLALKAGLRRRTRESYKLHVELHLKPALGHLRLAMLRPSDVERLKVQLLTKPAMLWRTDKGGGHLVQRGERTLSSRTAFMVLQTLRAALDQALDDELLDRNPARGSRVRLPRVPKPKRYPLEAAQADAFLRAAEHDRLYALWIVALYLGLREGELLGLKWEDVLWQPHQRVLRVQRQLERVRRIDEGGAPEFSDPKSETGKADLELSDTVLEALRTHRKRQLVEIEAAGEAWTDYGLVFCTPLGGPLRARWLISRFKALLADADLPHHVRLHDLRHTAGTMMALEGTDNATIAAVLRHADPAFTARTYTHSMASARAAVPAAMERRLGRRV